MNTSDEESDGHRQLVQQFCRGSEDAFQQLIRHEQFRVMGHLKKNFGNIEDPEGVCQDAWLKAWLSRSQLVNIDDNGFRRWMFTIVESCAIDAVRKANASKRTQNKNVKHGPQNVMQTNAVLNADLEDCVRELKKQNAAFYAALMKSIFGETALLAESLIEIEDLSQTPVDGSTLYTQKHRAISKLRDCLKMKGWQR